MAVFNFFEDILHNKRKNLEVFIEFCRIFKHEQRISNSLKMEMFQMKNILIVDDVLINRLLIKKIIEKRLDNICIIEADNGLEALEIIKEKDISVIILDINMSGMNGIEVLREIKDSPQHRFIPVIMCSELSEIENIERALSLGAMDFFAKPLTEEEMVIMLPLKIKNALKDYENNIQLNNYYQRIKEEMRLGEELQKTIIPPDYSQCNGLKIYGRYIPCEEIGGDFFSYKKLMGKTWFIIADISGHGISAAMISMMLNLAFLSGIERYKTPGKVLESINNILYKLLRGSCQGLVSAFIGFIEKDAIHFSNAGHPYPIIFRSSTNSIIEIEKNGLLLGIFEKTKYKTSSIGFNLDDVILLYTDGIFENNRTGNSLEWSFVKEFVKSNKGLLQRDLTKFLEEITSFSQKKFKKSFIDDVAIMAIKKEY